MSDNDSPVEPEAWTSENVQNNMALSTNNNAEEEAAESQRVDGETPTQLEMHQEQNITTITTGSLPTIEDHGVAAKTDSNPLLSTLVEETPEATRDWHKSLLFGLFLGSESLPNGSRHDKSFSECLARYKSNVKGRSGKTDYFTSRGVAQTDATQAATADSSLLDATTLQEPSPLCLIIPATLKENLGRQSLQQQHVGDCDSQYNAESLEQVEKHMASRFAESSIGIQAKSRPGAGEFKPISLVYNECSMSALAKWATKPSVDSVQEPAGPRLVPGASSSFRLCSVCKNFGHYEVQCEHLAESPTHAVEVAKEVKIQRNLHRFVSEFGYSEDPVENYEAPSGPAAKLNACEICKTGYNSPALLLCDGCDRMFHYMCLDPPLAGIPNGEWFCQACQDDVSDVSSTVMLEGLDGFVIEQRKRKSSSRLNHGDDDIAILENGWYKGVGVVESSLIPQEPSADPNNPPIADSNPVAQEERVDGPLGPGDLCWAMRRHAAEGSLGRNEWWPSVVVRECNRNYNYDADVLPYVVQMFCIPKVSCTRASLILPFFFHFEEHGYNRLQRLREEQRQTLEYHLFDKGVHEAIGRRGCTSLDQALQKARATVQEANRPRQEMNIPPAWKHAEQTRVEGLLILAKKDECECEGQTLGESSSARLSTALTESPMRKKARTSASLGEKSGLVESLSSTRLPGCIVAWDNEELREASSLNVGVVLAADVTKRIALVQSIPNWRDALRIPNGRRRRSAGNDRDVADLFHVTACPATASVWIKMEALQVICNGPKDLEQKLFVEKVLPQRLLAAQQSLSQQIPLASLPAMAITSQAFRPSHESAGAMNPSPPVFGNEKNDTGDSRAVDSRSPSLRPAALTQEIKSDGKDRLPRKGAESSWAPQLSVEAKKALGSLSATETEESEEEEENEDFGDWDDNNGDDDNGDESVPWRKAILLSDSEDDSSEDSEDVELQMQEEGVYQMEDIVGERRNSVRLREYLVKWKGFSSNENTWEPESNILNKNFVRRYKCETLAKKLGRSSEARQAGSATARMLAALNVGRLELSDPIPVPEEEKGDRLKRMCPFCEKVYRNALACVTHIKVHKSKPNYDAIKEGARIADIGWYGWT